jgi:hypothetical protein
VRRGTGSFRAVARDIGGGHGLTVVSVIAATPIPC